MQPLSINICLKTAMQLYSRINCNDTCGEYLYTALLSYADSRDLIKCCHLKWKE